LSVIVVIGVFPFVSMLRFPANGGAVFRRRCRLHRASPVCSWMSYERLTV
jgi:hypothetical protein